MSRLPGWLGSLAGVPVRTRPGKGGSMPSASSRRLARRLAVTAVVAAALGAGGAGIAAAATSNGSPPASASPSASASPRASSPAGRAYGPGRSGPVRERAPLPECGQRVPRLGPVGQPQRGLSATAAMAGRCRLSAAPAGLRVRPGRRGSDRRSAGRQVVDGDSADRAAAQAGPHPGRDLRLRSRAAAENSPGSGPRSSGSCARRRAA